VFLRGGAWEGTPQEEVGQKDGVRKIGRDFFSVKSPD
jgi:hypothetical protein